MGAPLHCYTCAGRGEFFENCGRAEPECVYRPVRNVKRCIRIEMLYVTSGDIFYLRLILLKRKACSDKDGLTYRGGVYLFCATATNNLLLHMVLWIALMTSVKHLVICVLMELDVSVEATLLC